MTPAFFLHDYYKKMLELQEKLRKSEEERIRLEERFNLMEQESRVRHEACINKLRMRYIEFLEEQRVRDLRNHKLLGTLDKVDTSLALMTAKTDRLYTLRKEYEASILRAQASRRQAGSVTGDSGIISQNDDRLMLRGASSTQVASSSHLDNLKAYNGPRATSSVPGNFYSSSSTPKKVYSGLPPLQFSSKTHLDSSEPFLRTIPSVNYQRSYAPKSLARNPEMKTWNEEDYATDLTKLRRDLRKDSGAFKYPAPERLTTLGSSRLSNLLGSKAQESSTIPQFRETAGSIVEKELESYINKIRSLHDNNNDQHSLEEVDHEQNTSGDLLNVTLSDDGFDHLPAEEKAKGHLHKEVGQILALVDDLAAKTADLNANAPTGLNAVQEIKILCTNQSELMNETLIEPKVHSAVTEEASGLISDGINGNFNTELSDKDQNEETKVEIVDFDKKEELNTEIVVAQEQEVDNLQETGELEPWNLENSEKQVKVIDDLDLNDNLELQTELVNNDNEILQTALVNEIPVVNPDGEVSNDSVVAAENVYDQNYTAGEQNYPEENYEENKEYTEQVYEYENQEYQYDPNTGEYQYPYDPNAEYQDQQYPEETNQEYQYPEGYTEQNYDTNYEYPAEQYEGYDQEQQQLNQEDLIQADTIDPEGPVDVVDLVGAEEDNNYQEDLISKASNEESPIDSSKKDKDEVNGRAKKTKDTIRAILESDTESTMEKNTSNTESDFDFK
ncbi:uncharacterized protein LOC123268360 isoform X3 [Cotesia glomerata]|uniref:uncharacterized protein LOC123268360 isoform X2 n=1 Tax=Cotesia glomerata TaxID=32391 RepID=UPI001D014870|nr:uncharacterized protein LOC123268360 isoform X2 [Cotesia glomerata]XP_044589306.1 uncharacterized protein LOC123268360 isoform X3 [Cotesia glomerata]